jgi:hypothetical protein
MGHELICTWLQLPAGTWPPDHYTLLGLKCCEHDLMLIEQKVHERMETMRRYQLIHPEPATEAMNRLAQALICLTDPQAKKGYDAEHFPELVVAAVPASPEAGAPVPEPLAWLFGPPPPGLPGFGAPDEPQTLSDWQTAPPPQRATSEMADWQTAPPPPRTAIEVLAGQAAPPVPDLPSEAPVPGAPADPVLAAEGSDSPPTDAPAVAAAPAEPVAPAPEPIDLSAASRRGLGTRRALFYRVLQIRQLLWAWDQAGKYVNRPTRPVNRPSEATDLIHHMTVIRDLLRTFPPVLGRAGQPGYLVVSLACQPMIVPTLHKLSPGQREALARHWQEGREQLLAHRTLLREELRKLRRRNRLGQAFRAVIVTLRDRPIILLGLLALAALNFALREYLWLWEVLAAGVLVAIWGWHVLRPSRPTLPPRPVVVKKKTSKATQLELPRVSNSSRT